MPNSDPELLTADELAAQLKVHVESVHRWSRSRPPRIPFTVLPSGQRRYVLRQVIEALSAEPSKASA